MNQQHLITPAQPSHTGQTGIPHRSDRSGLCATQIQKSGVPGRIVGVSGLPSLENPDLYPVCLSHPKIRRIQTNGRTIRPYRSNRYTRPVRPVLPRPNLESTTRRKSCTNSKTLIGTSSWVHMDAFDQRKIT